MKQINWVDEFSAAVTICNKELEILYMNNKSRITFSKYGGAELLGKNLNECHKPESLEKIQELINTGRTNCYTIEKEGIKKLIYQAPWYENGEISGIIEISMEIPLAMDHFVRK